MTPAKKGPAADTTGHTLTSGFSTNKYNQEQRQADSSTLRQIAGHFGGEVHGNRVVFPTPGHSAKDRGSVATLIPDAPDGILVHSFNGGDPIAIKAELRSAGVLAQWRAADRTWCRFGRCRSDLRKHVAAPVAVRAPVDGRMQQHALQLWHEARAPAGTPAERYLTHEGTTQLPADAARFLRFHPACPFGTEKHPAMLVLVRSVATGEP